MQRLEDCVRADKIICKKGVFYAMGGFLLVGHGCTCHFRGSDAFKYWPIINIGWCLLIYLLNTYTVISHFLKYASLITNGLNPCFAFRTTLILSGRDSTRCWKHSLQIFVHVDLTASRGSSSFVGLRIHDVNFLVQPHPSGALLGWCLVTVLISDIPVLVLFLLFIIISVGPGSTLRSCFFPA